METRQRDPENDRGLSTSENKRKETGVCREGSCWGEGSAMDLCPSLPIVSVRRHQMTFSVNLEKNRGQSSSPSAPKKVQSQSVNKTNHGPAACQALLWVWSAARNTDW